MTTKTEDVFLVTQTVENTLFYWCMPKTLYSQEWSMATFYTDREDAETCAIEQSGVVKEYNLFVVNHSW